MIVDTASIIYSVYKYVGGWTMESLIVSSILPVVEINLKNLGKNLH
jgi:hypothetical protein